jgi:hypothetical protein
MKFFLSSFSTFYNLYHYDLLICKNCNMNSLVLSYTFASLDNDMDHAHVSYKYCTIAIFVGYGPLLVIHLILVRSSFMYLSIFFHYLLYPVLFHHDWVHVLIVLHLIHLLVHISSSYQCFPPYPMHPRNFICLIPWSSHLFHTIKY